MGVIISEDGSTCIISVAKSATSIQMDRTRASA